MTNSECVHDKKKNHQPTYDSALLDSDTLLDLSDFFKTMGDSTRIRIIYLLSVQEMCVCEIAEALKMEQSAISHQLRKLKQARFVKVRREGKQMVYSLDDQHIVDIFQVGLDHLNEGKE